MTSKTNTTENVDESTAQACCVAGPFAERIASRIMMRLGFREPKKHTSWISVANLAQDIIDNEIDVMKRVAGNDPVIAKKHILLYESHASWWIRYIGFRWMQDLSARYLAWKVNRKFRRYDRSLRHRELLRREGLI